MICNYHIAIRYASAGRGCAAAASGGDRVKAGGYELELRLAAPAVRTLKRNTARPRGGRRDARRHLPTRDVRNFVHRGLDRSTAQQNIFAIAPSDLSTFGQLCQNPADHRS